MGVGPAAESVNQRSDTTTTTMTTTKKKMKKRGTKKTEASTAAWAREQDWGDGRVLVVEDQFINAKILVNALKSLGIDEANILVAKNGEEGLAVLTADVEASKDAPLKRIRVVLMDINMPKMDGKECTKRCREIDQAHPYCIIGVTANAGEAAAALSAGMDECLFKPLGLSGIQRALCKGNHITLGRALAVVP